MTLEYKKSDQAPVLSVAVPVPLRQTFDFIASDQRARLTPRTRVKVSFGKRVLVGVIVEIKSTSDYPINKLKPVLEILDEQPLFDDALWQTLIWLSRYYLAPIGEVITGALPVVLRKDETLEPTFERAWQLTDHGRSASIDELARAPMQLAIIKRFTQHTSVLSSSDFKQTSSNWHTPVKALVDKGWLSEISREPTLNERKITRHSELTLTEEQNRAIEVLDTLVNKTSAATGEASKFSCSLLHGVTGSGKTEVYFSLMHRVLTRGDSVLLLVPEIGLTPQLIQRIEENFSEPIALLHSGLNDTERHLAWWHARNGNARIILGTRSAVFTQIPDLGLIIVDEEHDVSFKQQDGVRYQARDVAIYRAKQHNIPIVLGSATPCLETFHNAIEGRYQYLQLTKRASDVALPKIELFDLNTQAAADGLCPGMCEAIEHTLALNKQVILFLNRRGYAPVHYCTECKTAAKCHRCDSNLTVHQRANKLRCHHCGYEGPLIEDCRNCNAKNSMREVGDGTQRVEAALAARFSDARLLRIDRDSTQRKGELAKLLEQARVGEADILLGTQLISKGHDFPKVGMVGVLEADQGLYSTDYRASETLFQQVLQVAGRAGRREDIGRVYIQTRFPEHDFFRFIQNHDFSGFANEMLNQRRAAGFPPFGYFALLRAESTHQAKALQFLRRAKSDCGLHPNVIIMDAVPAPMERRAGRYRAQLLFLSNQRSALNGFLSNWLHYVATNADAKKIASTVRWSLDIDPLDHY